MSRAALPLTTAFAFVVGAMWPGSAAGEALHWVQPGDTLWHLATAYGCEVEDLRIANELPDNHIEAGMKLRIPRCVGEDAEDPEAVAKAAAAAAAVPTELPEAPAYEPGKVVEHVVGEGDTLWKISQKYETTVAEIKLRNGLGDDKIYAGQKLELLPGSGETGKVLLGQSVGTPQRGRLVHPTRLPPGRGYHRRRPSITWGTNYAVYHTRRVVNAVRRKFPRVHRLAIGDLSAKSGGEIPRHSSHESGRDVDLGFYYRKKPRRYPEEFVSANGRNLHFAATFHLIETLARTADIDGGVERMFLGYQTQRMLYHWAKENGVSKKKLRQIFQYPHGRWAMHGLVRHEPAHEDHLHVRFKCPEEDESCR